MVKLPVAVNGETLVTMSLLEVYNATAWLLTDAELDPNTPVGMYTAKGIGSVIALAHVGEHGEELKDTTFVALVGNELPYGVAVEKASIQKIDSRMPHRVEGVRSLQELIDETRRMDREEQAGGDAPSAE
jgi:hypothetical protein